MMGFGSFVFYAGAVLFPKTVIKGHYTIMELAFIAVSWLSWCILDADLLSFAFPLPLYFFFFS